MSERGRLGNKGMGTRLNTKGLLLLLSGIRSLMDSRGKGIFGVNGTLKTGHGLQRGHHPLLHTAAHGGAKLRSFQV